MNEEYPDIKEDTPSMTQDRFPVLAQLSVLGIIMFSLFGGFIFGVEEPINTDTPPLIISDSSKQSPVVLEKIDEPPLRATAAYVWDVRTQRALYSKNAFEELPLASITKLMTALLAHELMESSQPTTISLNAIRQEGSSGLLAGEELTADELRELALISSSNDAAFALAASVGVLLGDNDPTAQFIRGMNIRADMLGLETLEFWNTTGLDLSLTKPGSIGSARDVSFLMEYIITEYPEILEPTMKASTRVYNSSGDYHDANNTNPIVLDIPNLLGSKTGFTDLAGGNLTIAFDAGLNRPIIITVLGSTRDERFTDVLTLVQAVQESIGKQE
ncbi:MAG: serine hydrolase [Candidatus Pacebacteria bacterium]|nr:serine hydrolase [Candidatus Paceibacterota bacterium]